MGNTRLPLQGNLPHGRGATPFSSAGTQAILGLGLQSSALMSATQRHNPKREGRQCLLAEHRGGLVHTRLSRPGGCGTCRTINCLPPGAAAGSPEALCTRAAILRRA